MPITKDTYPLPRTRTRYQGHVPITKDTYPLPRISEVIDKMDGTKLWTTLDAASAYWSVPLAETDKEKTSFSLPRGKYEFNVTPYGLCNAGVTDQRMMDLTMAGLSSKRVLAYLDDW